MKYLLLFTGSLFFFQSYCQAPDSLYAVTYTVGSLWDNNKPPQEQPYFSDHSSHLSKLRKDGTIKMGARYADKGLIVIQAKSLELARKIIGNDLAVVNKLFNTDIQKFNLFYEGCLEKPK